MNVSLNETIVLVENLKSDLVPTSVMDYIIVAVSSILAILLMWNLLKESFKALLIGLGLVVLCIITLKLMMIM